MMNKAVLFILFASMLLVQKIDAKNPDVYKVSYANYENARVGNEPSTSILYAENIVALDAATNQIQSFIDFEKNQNLDFITFEEELFKLITSFDSLPKPFLKSDLENILGYECKHAEFTSFSNKIEVWYTEEAKAKGSPYKNYLPTKNALVLKVVINGSYGLVATKIEKLKKAALPILPSGNAKQISSAEFEELKIKSRYKSIQIFSKEIVNFEGDLDPPVGDLKANKTYRFSKGTVILRKIGLPQMLKEGAYVYAKLTCSSLGDAYDRTGSVFLLPVNSNKLSMLNALQFGVDKLPVTKDNLGEEYQGFVSDENYTVPTEVMRFFTSFGVDYFNNRRPINNYNWENSAVYKQEITTLIPNDNDSVWVGVFIGNYSKEGHQVSLELDFYPGFENPENTQKLIEPLFLTVNLMEMSGQNYPNLFGNDTLKVEFDVPENAENLQLLFTSTGHGGWGGGDEFNQKINQIFIDGNEVYKVIPWRTDCASYRFSNPASGNFSNGMSSSDLSRSNWCPATLTPPYIVPLKNLSSGHHTLKLVINQGEAEGGSFSHWGVSGVLVGNLKE